MLVRSRFVRHEPMLRGQLNPFKWDNPKTFSYVIGGAITGAASGALGGFVSGVNMAFANTLGIISSSFVSSIGMSIVTGGQSSVSIGFGIASYNLQTGNVGYLGEKGNSFVENLGYSLGAFSNVQDVLAGFKPGEVQLQTENIPGSKDGKQSDLIGHSQITDMKGNSLIDFGPGKEGGLLGIAKGRNDWTSYSTSGSTSQVQNMTGNVFKPITIKGVNLKTMNRISTRLNSNPKFYNFALRSCSSVAQRALMASGKFFIGGIHPYTLRLSAILGNNGFSPSHFSHYLYR